MCFNIRLFQMFSSQHISLRKLLQEINNEHEINKKILTNHLTSQVNHTNANHHEQAINHVINVISKKTKSNLLYKNCKF